MHNKYSTARLELNELTEKDYDFISELLNTRGWIEFIGDRKIHSKEDAVKYILGIINDPKIKYWVVKNSERKRIGIITLIKRDYLDHHDIGFAFLPQFAKQGYAFEATRVVLDDIRNKADEVIVLATTIGSNINSIRLLEKLGFHFSKEIVVEKEKLLLYSIGNDNN